MKNKIFGTLLALLFLLPSQAGSEGTPITDLAIQVVLLDIRTYEEYKEIRDNLKKFAGVHRVVSRSIAPGLITLGIEFSGDSKELTAHLRKNLGQYKIDQKTLPSEVTEINISK